MFLKRPPVPLRTPENAAAIQEAYDATSALRQSGITGFVLLELTVARDGSVESAEAIMPQATLPHVEAISIDATTGRELPSLPPHTLHSELCRAAESAARKMRFQPASILGRPVRYSGLRHGFSFD